MSCFISLYSFSGEDQNATAKKLALMFKIAPQQASAIIDQVSKGEVWRTPKEVSDQQAAVVEKYLKGIGFQVERSGQQATVDQIAESVKLEIKSSPDRPDKMAGSPGSGVMTDEGPPGQAPPTSSALKPPGNGGTTGSGGPPQDMPIEFHGTGGGLFKIMFVNFILTLLTLGIYSFWGKTKVRRYLCEQSSFAGDRFYYHGTGWELFRGALIFGAMFGLFNLGMYSVGQIWGMEAQMIAQTVVMPLLIIFLLPIILVGAFKYRLSRTAWRGIRFSFRGKRKSALWLYIKGYLFTALTLGLYWPFFYIKLQKFWRSEAYFGNQSFTYKGKGWDIFKVFLLMILLYVVCMGIPVLVPTLVPGIDPQIVPLIFVSMWILLIVGFMYYSAFLDRYNWSKTQFAGGRFNYNATGGQWLLLNFTNILLTIVTLGFGIPLAEVRSRRFFANHIRVAGNMQLSQVVQEAQKSSALGEGVADGFDIDIDIGI